jgi:hypothetical protein
MQDDNSNTFSILDDMDLAKKASLMVIMVDNNDFTYFDSIKELERARMALKKKVDSIEEQIE